MYPLAEILFHCLLAALVEAKTTTDIVRFGEKTFELLRRFQPFRAILRRMTA